MPKYKLVPHKRDVTVGTGSTLILRQNAIREWATFVNAGATDIWVQEGAPAVLNTGLKVVSNGTYQVDKLTYWDGEVYAISSGACLMVGIEMDKESL